MYHILFCLRPICWTICTVCLYKKKSFSISCNMECLYQCLYRQLSCIMNTLNHTCLIQKRVPIAILHVADLTVILIVVLNIPFLFRGFSLVMLVVSVLQDRGKTWCRVDSMCGCDTLFYYFYFCNHFYSFCCNSMSVFTIQ